MARNSLLPILAVVAAVLALGVGAATLDATDLAGSGAGAAGPPAAPPTAGGGPVGASGGPGGGGSGDCTLLCSLPVGGVPLPTDLVGGPTAPVALLVGVVLAAALLAHRATGGDAGLTPASEGDREGPVVAPPGARSADPAPSQPPADNEVYRAWRALRDRLDAPPTRSPAEVAADARAAGLDRDAVATLTETFRAVRYGGHRVTDDRETAAADAHSTLTVDGGGS